MAYAELEHLDKRAPNKNRICITTEMREKDLVKQIPGVRWDRQERTWFAPMSWGTAWAIRAVFGKRIEIGTHFRDWVRQHNQDNIQPLLEIRDKQDVDLGREWQRPLWPFQRVGAQFLALTSAALLADEMGTGKTVQAISGIRLLGKTKVFPALVVCPNSMKWTWKKEFDAWWPNARVEVVSGSAGQRRKQIEVVKNGEADVLVANWEILHHHSRIAGYGSIHLTDKEKEEKELNQVEWLTIIADEAHRAKSPHAKQTRALWWLGRNAQKRIALTGTPIANHPGDLWSLLHFLRPEDWPSKTKYANLFCLLSWNPFGGQEITDLNPKTRAAFDAVFDPMFLRRTKKAVLPQLPDKIYTVRWLEMPSKQRRSYDQLRKTMIAELDDDTIGLTVTPLVKAMRLLQLSSSYAEADLADPQIWKLKDPSNKVDALFELLEEMDPDKSLVVFAESRQLIEIAGARLIKHEISHGYVTGAVTGAERQRNIDDFQAGKLRVLLVTLGAGGEGITLTRASTAIFLQRSWSMVKNLQGEDRIHRIGQEGDSVNIIDLVSIGTLEEYRMDKLDSKLSKLEDLVQDETALRTALELRP